MEHMDGEEFKSILQNEGDALFKRINTLSNKEDILFILLYFEWCFWQAVEAYKRENPDVDYNTVKTRAEKFVTLLVEKVNNEHKESI